ncbi:MAG: histidine phosphatase family protein [Geminicoccaceae bacterium]
MTSFYLVRHGAHVLQDQVLVGRSPGIELSDAGRRQVEALARYFRTIPLDVVRSGPLHRARTTADALTAEVEVDDAMDEIDYGEWTGRDPAELGADPAWRAWNAQRGAARVPAGESMQEVQNRAVGAVQRLRRELRDAKVALVTHGDVLRAILVFYLGMPLDLLGRLTVDPGSVSHLVVQPWGPTLVELNRTSF